ISSGSASRLTRRPPVPFGSLKSKMPFGESLATRPLEKWVASLRLKAPSRCASTAIRFRLCATSSSALLAESRRQNGHNRIRRQSLGRKRSDPHFLLSDLGLCNRGSGVPDRSRYLGDVLGQGGSSRGARGCRCRRQVSRESPEALLGSAVVPRRHVAGHA